MLRDFEIHTEYIVSENSLKDCVEVHAIMRYPVFGETATGFEVRCGKVVAKVGEFQTREDWDKWKGVKCTIPENLEFSVVASPGVAD